MAIYYWVGGSGTWDNSAKTNWATSSGGAGGFGPPTNADTVNFDANSGTAAVVTVASTAVCAGCTINKSDITLSLSGNVTFTGVTNLTSGTLTLNDNVLTAGYFNINNSNVRTINFGVGNITLTASNLTVWAANTLTNFSYTGTPLVKLSASVSSGTRGISHGNAANSGATTSISFSVTSGTDTVTVAGTATDLDCTGFAGTLTIAGVSIYGNVYIPAGVTSGASAVVSNFLPTSGVKTLNTSGITLNFPLTITAGTATLQLLSDLILASNRTLTLTSGTLDFTGGGNWSVTTGLFASNNSNTRAIVFGTGSITVTGSGTVWNMSSVSNFSYTGTPTVNIANNSATAATVATGALTEAQSLNFNYTTGTYALTDTNAVYKSVSFAGFGGTVPNSTRTVYGNFTASATATNDSGTNTTTFASTSGVKNIALNGVTLDYPVTFNGVGGSWKFTDTFSLGSTRTLTLTNGTLDANGNNVSLGSFALGAGTKTLTLGSGTWTVTGANWNANTNVANLTVSASVGTISMTSASAKTFAGGGKTWPTLNQGGAGALTIQQSNTFANITSTTLPSTITLTAGTTQSLTAFTLAGTAGNLVTLNSSSAGSRATIAPAVNVTNVSYISFKDIAATTSAVFAYTFNGNVNGGNNAGIRFNLADISILPCVFI